MYGRETGIYSSQCYHSSPLQLFIECQRHPYTRAATINNSNFLKVSGILQTKTHCGGNGSTDNRCESVVRRYGTQAFINVDNGYDTISGEASLKSSVEGPRDKCSPGDTCTDRKGRGMETTRVVGFRFCWSVYTLESFLV